MYVDYYLTFFLIIKFSCDAWSCFSQVSPPSLFLNVTCQHFYICLLYIISFHFNIFYILVGSVKEISVNFSISLLFFSVVLAFLNSRKSMTKISKQLTNKL
jgi:hypothetical protein